MELNIGLLQELSLSEYEAKAYIVLLQRHHLSATEIALLSKVPKSRIYSVLSKLERKQFCTRVPGRERVYKVLDPKTSIAKEITFLEEKRNRFNDIAEILSENYLSNKSGDNPLDYIEIFNDFNIISENFNRLEEKCTLGVKSLLKPPFIIDRKKILDGDIPNPHKKGLKYVSIYDSSCLQMDHFIETMKFFQKTGLEVRICDNIPVKAMIFDQKTVAIQLSDKVSNGIYSTLFIHHEDLVLAFEALFSQYYQCSLSLDDKLQELNKEGS